MKDDASRYDELFFENQQQGSMNSARLVLPIVLEQFKPSSLVDVGCGVGGWAAVAMDLGVKHVIGIDGNYVSPDQLKIPRDKFVAIDLTKDEAQLDERFDLCMSLEVAEHLPPGRARGFVQMLTALSDVVLFSAAIPHQGGRNHINERWQSYWVRLFNEHSYGAQDLVRPRVWTKEGVESWYRQNCLVFVKDTLNDKDIGLYDVVHPDRYVRRIMKLSQKRTNASPAE